MMEINTDQINPLHFFDSFFSPKGYFEIRSRYKKELEERKTSGHPLSPLTGYKLPGIYFERVAEEVANAVSVLKRIAVEFDSNERLKIYLNCIYGFVKAYQEKCNGTLSVIVSEEEKQIYSWMHFHLDSLKRSIELNFPNYVEADPRSASFKDFDSYIIERLKELLYLLTKYEKSTSEYLAYQKKLDDFPSKILRNFLEDYPAMVKTWLKNQIDLGNTASEAEYLKLISQHLQRKFPTDTSVIDYGDQNHDFDREIITKYLRPIYDEIARFFDQRAAEINVSLVFQEECAGKVQTSLTIAGLAYLFQVMIEIGVFPGVNKTELAKVIARHFESKGTKAPSLKNIMNQFTNPTPLVEKRTAEIGMDIFNHVSGIKKKQQK